MTIRFQPIIPLAFLFLCLFTTRELPAKNVTVTDFGAIGDASTLNTNALQSAIDACAESGGGEVLVPPGSYITGTIFLRSHVELRLSRGAVIMGSTDNPKDYPVRSMIVADGIEAAGISGPGIIDGQARHPDFIAKGYRVNDGKRPYAIYYKDSRRMSLTDVEIRDAGSWTVRLFRCDGVKIDGISLHCLAQGNNDGIDVDARNVTISNCRINADDDGICLKSDDPDFLPENITITNCIISSNCNPIKLGTASRAGFRNVTVSNCVIRRTEESNIWDWSKEYRRIAPGTRTGLAGIAIESADGGIIEHLTFTNITMEGIITPIFICLNRRKGNGTGIIRNIHISNITAVAEGIIPCIITGIPGSRVSDITLRDISVEHNGGEQPMTKRLPESLNGYPENRMFGHFNPAGGLYVRHADNIIVENFRIRQRNTDYRPAVVVDDVTDLRIEGLQSVGSESSAMVQAIESRGITLEGREITNIALSDKGLAKHDFEFADKWLKK